MSNPIQRASTPRTSSLGPLPEWIQIGCPAEDARKVRLAAVEFFVENSVVAESLSGSAVLQRDSESECLGPKVLRESRVMQ